jgi:hypothetical protein
VRVSLPLLSIPPFNLALPFNVTASPFLSSTIIVNFARLSVSIFKLISTPVNFVLAKESMTYWTSAVSVGLSLSTKFTTPCLSITSGSLCGIMNAKSVALFMVRFAVTTGEVMSPVTTISVVIFNLPYTILFVCFGASTTVNLAAFSVRLKP